MMDWISPFLETRAAEANAAENTQLGYGRDLKDFATFLQGRKASFKTASEADIEAYLIYCDAQGLAVTTRARRLSSIKQLFRFAWEEGLRGDNPALDIHGPGARQALPQSLSMDEVNRLLKIAPRFGKTEGDKLRMACLMEVLYATGLRVTELMSLPLVAVRGDPRVILVRGKGGKERMVPPVPRCAGGDFRPGCQCVMVARSIKHPPIFSRRGANWGITRATGSFYRSKRWRCRRGLTQRKSPPTACATPLPPIC